MAKFPKQLGSMISTIGSGLVGGLTGKLSDSMFPTDPAAQAKDMMDELYPGTTGHERLFGGANTASAGASESASQRALKQQAAEQAKDRALKADELKTNAEVARQTNQTRLAQGWMDNMTLRGLSFSGNPGGAAVGIASGMPEWIKTMMGDSSTAPAATPDAAGKYVPRGGSNIPYWNEYTKEKAAAISKKRIDSATRASKAKQRQSIRNKSHQNK